MAVIPNVSKGRVNEYVRRVRAGDPATSRLVVVLLQASESAAVLAGYDTLADLLAPAGNTEVTVVSYARLVLTSALITDPVVDDTANTQAFDPGDYSFGALEAGQSVAAAVVCYIPVTGGADSTAVPLHVTVPTVPLPLNGEILYYRTPVGLWVAS